MAGRRQHHIPRLLLRGFLADLGDRAERVWVVRRNGKAFAPSIADVACERDFYSSPSADGAKTLDQKITDYENRLGRLVQSLRALNIGDPADSEVVSEVIAHLVPRSASIRLVMDRGMKGIVAGATSAFADEGTIAQMLGLSSSDPEEKFHELFENAVAGQLETADIPVPVVERIAFFLAQERLPQVVSGLLPQLEHLLKALALESGDLIRESHQKALAEGLVAPGHQDLLRSYDWHVVSGPREGVLLPDCIVLASVEGGALQPYFLRESTKADAIVFPISGSKLIVGKLPSAELPSLATYNDDAIACSASFVVSATRPHDDERIASSIGQRSIMAVDEQVAAAVKGALAPRLSATTSVACPELNDRSPSQNFSFTIHFPGDFDAATCTGISAAVKEVVESYCVTRSLSRLDGITFATDYVNTIAGFDGRAQPLGEANTIDQQIGYAYSQAPLVFREDVAKAHIVMRAELGRALISEDPAALEFAVHALVYELAEVSFIEVFDSALPSVLASPFPDQHTANLFPVVFPAIRSYFAARTSASILVGRQFETMTRENFVAAIDYARDTILVEAAEFRRAGDLDRLFGSALRIVALLLRCSANWIGHCDGLGLLAADTADELTAKLHDAKLTAWLPVFGADLRRLWERRGAWREASEFLALMRHVERLLWEMRMIPWKLDSGQTYVRLF